MRQRIAVVGSGIAGMSAAWLLSSRHDVTVYEAETRFGGHSNTVAAPLSDGRSVPVDTGFIVYNELNYPNLTALFRHLGVETRHAEMDFAVSLDDGDLEYGSATPMAVFAQRRNLVRPRFWAMLRDLVRFYREAPADPSLRETVISIGEYLENGGYGSAFLDDHLFPQAAAIWSSSVGEIRDYPAAALVRFFDNHGLLKLANRPQWRTVVGGSAHYVSRITANLAPRARLGCAVSRLIRRADQVLVEDATGETLAYDQVLLACHADQALALLSDPTLDERRTLGAFAYTRNTAVLHTDTRLMPRRRAAWSSWNYIGERSDRAGRCVTYWMNRLQSLDTPEPLLLTLNPYRPPEAQQILRTETYHHPLFDQGALAAQSQLWSLQGIRRTWYCGSYFGSGFHEDALQAGLAAAEAMGGVRRPWQVADESGRIQLGPAPVVPSLESAA